jgi:hypothetical protein
LFWSFETGDPPEGWGVRRTNFEHLKIVSDFDIRTHSFGNISLKSKFWNFGHKKTPTFSKGRGFFFAW